MPSQKSIPISELITTANSELLRLDFKRSALQIYCAEFRKFSDYYSNEKIQDYTATTGREYFQSIYGVNIASPRLQLTKSQSATRRAIRLLDDIFQFGYALRYCHRSYTVNPEYDILLESYLMKCRKKHNSQGTLRTKQMKLCQFFEYIEGRNIQLACLTSADLSNFMTTLCRCRRPTLYTTASVLKDFLRYLYESEQFTKDLSADVPKPKIYDNFRELLFACNIPHTGNGPRVHDFRHTFAVHTLEKQLSDGYDPMVIVPRLAAYLGHKSYRETCWYIHLTVASFPELSQKLDRAFVGIIPVGGETDEEN